MLHEAEEHFSYYYILLLHKIVYIYALCYIGFVFKHFGKLLSLFIYELDVN